MAGKWGTAKRDGKCPNCKRPVIFAGSAIFNRNGAWLCEECGLVAENTPASVLESGIEEAALKDLGNFPEEVQESAFAKAILFMARQLDLGDVGPREVTQYTKEIRLNFMQLRDLYPPDEEGDATDEARTKRERRAREQGGY